jgi:protoheme IX farnesyltransferase
VKAIFDTKVVETPSLQSAFRSLYRLTKPTITLLVVFTAIPGLLLAQDSNPSWTLWFAVIVGTALSSASAAVFNQVIDARIDEQMVRTHKRPLPQGAIDTKGAIAFGLGLGILGTGILCAMANPFAAGVALSANIFYVVVYTLILKRLTVQNIVIGGAAGAVGPLIGWSAVQGDLGVAAWMMFALIFLWTPPHFWALAIKYKDDYARAGIPMLPVVSGDAVTRRDIMIYSWTLFIPIVILAIVGSTGIFATAVSALLTIVFVKKAWDLFRSQSNEGAMPLFHYSCLYLFGVFGAISIERIAIMVI